MRNLNKFSASNRKINKWPEKETEQSATAKNVCYTDTRVYSQLHRAPIVKINQHASK